MGSDVKYCCIGAENKSVPKFYFGDKQMNVGLQRRVLVTLKNVTRSKRLGYTIQCDSESASLFVTSKQKIFGVSIEGGDWVHLSSFLYFLARFMKFCNRNIWRGAHVLKQGSGTWPELLFILWVRGLITVQGHILSHKRTWEGPLMCLAWGESCGLDEDQGARHLTFLTLFPKDCLLPFFTHLKIWRGPSPYPDTCGWVLG